MRIFWVGPCLGSFSDIIGQQAPFAVRGVSCGGMRIQRTGGVHAFIEGSRIFLV
jgi:hypothetical protein